MGLIPLPDEHHNVSTVHDTGLGSGSVDSRSHEPSRQGTEPPHDRAVRVLDIGCLEGIHASQTSPVGHPGHIGTRIADT